MKASIVVALPVGMLSVVLYAPIAITQTHYDDQRVVLIAALAASVVLLQRSAQRIPASTLAAAVLAAGLLSALLSARPIAALADWSVYALLIAFVLHGARQLDGAKTALWLCAGLAGSYVFAVLARIASSWLVGLPLGSEAFIVGLDNPRFPAHLQLLTLPLFPFVLGQLRGRLRVALSAVFVLWWMCAFGSGSRTAWLALIAAAGVAAACGAEGRRWLRSQAGHAGAGLLLYLLLFHLLPAITGEQGVVEQGRLGEAGSIRARFDLWRHALALAWSSPLLGVGPAHFSYGALDITAAHPHNLLLQLAAEWGLVVAAIVAGAAAVAFGRLFLACRKAAAARDDAQRSQALAVLAAFTAWLVAVQLDGIMVIPSSQVVAALVLAMVGRELAGASAAPIPPQAALVHRAPWLALLAVAFATLAALPFTPYGRPTERDQAWRVENPTVWAWPRFWRQGWIDPQRDPSARPDGWNRERGPGVPARSTPGR